MKSNIMKVISFIVLIVGLIGSIASGVIFQTYDFDKQRFVFNSELTIGSIIDVILFFYSFLHIHNNTSKVRGHRK